MPVKDGMPFLRAALRSIAEQRYDRQRIIAWDNGSTDGSQAELQRWIPSRIPGEIVLDRPLPLGQSRAALVERVTTEFCVCQDADDLSAPDRVSTQVAYMLDHPSVVALGAVPNIIDEDDRPLGDWFYPLGDAEIRWRTKWQCSLNASSVVFRRSAVLAAGNYGDLDRAQDMDLWARLSHVGPFANLPDRLVSYRRHSRNLTTGVVDYYDFDLRIAERNAAILFPDLEAPEALRLWRAAYPRREAGRATMRDVVRLHAAARRAARAIGQRPDYFTNTPYFRYQRSIMVKNAIEAIIGRKTPGSTAA